MIFLEEMKNLKIYKKPFFLPYVDTNKKNGSAIFLLTPNYQSSKKCMSLPYMINRNKYQSYYVEKNVNYFINSKITSNMDMTQENYMRNVSKNDLLYSDYNSSILTEDNLTAKDRNRLRDKTFGLPDERKYPLNDEDHVRAAIKFFNYVDKSKEKELANNIIKAIKKFNIDTNIGKKNRLSKYIPINEIGLDLPKTLDNIDMGDIPITVQNDNDEVNIKFNGYLNDIKVTANELVDSDVIEAFNRLDLENIDNYCFNFIIKNVFDEDNSISIKGDKEKTVVDIEVYSKEVFENNYDEVYHKYLMFNVYYSLCKIAYLDSDDDIIMPYSYYLSDTNTEDDYINKNIYIMSGMDVSELKDAIKNNLTKYFNQELEDRKDPSDVSIEESKKHPMDSTYLKYMTYHIKYAGKKGKFKMRKVARGVEKDIEDRKADNKDISKVGSDSSSSGSASDSDGDKAPEIEIKEALELHLSDIDESNYLRMGDNYLFLNEDAKYDPVLKKILYNDRIKQQKDILLLYKKVKDENSFIKFTFTDIEKYKGKNLFIDTSFYNEIFFRNNTMYKLDRAVDLYMDLIERLVDDKRFNGYKKKTIFVPIKDWSQNPNTRMWMYKDDINPVSVIYRMLQKDPSKVKQIFGNKDLVFLADNSYFKINFSTIEDKDMKLFILKFKNFVDKIMKNQEFDLEDMDDTPSDIESSKAIATNIIDKIESKGIKIDPVKHGIPGAVQVVPAVNPKTVKVSSKKLEVKDPSDKKKEETFNNNKDVEVKSNISKNTPSTELKKQEIKNKELDDKKEKLIDVINTVAKDSENTDAAIEKMDDDFIKKLIIDLSMEEDEAVKINSSRAARMAQLNSEVLDKEIKGVKLKDLLDSNPKEDENPIPKSSINIATPFKENWKDLTYTNFDKGYDINKDISKMIVSLSEKTYPLSIRDLTVEDTSTSEDYIDTYTILLEDFRGKRFTIKMDVPKFKDSKYLILRGNKKTIQNQYFNMPVLKTDEDTCQVISNYQKIFIRRYGSTVGKSNIFSDILLKTLRKYDGKLIKIESGDNGRLCSKYELPIDYIDLSSALSKIETNNYILYFNQDTIRSLYEIDESKGFPFGYNKVDKHVMYFNIDNVFSKELMDLLISEDERLKEIISTCHKSTKYVYSKCSILSSEIPLIVVACYSEGIQKVLNKAKVNYKLVEKLDKSDKTLDKDFIKFKDGYLVYDNNYSSSLLLNGLKECDTESHSLTEINNKSMYLEFLDNYGGRIKADGLDNFYDCMIDPITKEVCKHYKLPTDYIDLLIYANNLLADNSFINHTDSSSRRIRRGELIAVKVYKALFNDAYCSYANQIRHGRRNAQFSLKQSAVIDKFMTDSISSDLSIINCLNDIESSNAVTTKGEQGMNSDRSYTLDKRTYDDSMLNILGMSTGFAGNVGVTRQSTIDMNIEGERGYIKSINGDTSKLNTTKTLTITEALTPFGTTRDDPFRTAMTFIQTSKHALRTEKGDPLLITNGAGDAVPYLCSNIFAFKAKMAGKVIEKDEKGMLIEYTNKEKDYIKLEPVIEKNSDGGFYTTVELQTDLKLGSSFKPDQVLAYDKTSFSKGALGEANELSYNIGKLSKVAIINSDEGFEDSAIVTDKLSEEMATRIIMKKERDLSKDTNIYNLIKVGTQVQEGDVLFMYQKPFDEEDINILMKNLTADKEEISELGMETVKSPTTGVIKGINIIRTVDIEELSESLKKVVEEYENPINDLKTKLKDNNIDTINLPSTDKLPPTGKLKNCQDGLKIEIYIEYYDKGAVGDKIVFYSANKGVIKDIIPKGKEPYTDFRPNEEISAFASVSSINKRMTDSIIINGALNKLMVELDRSVKDTLEIKYDDSQI